jgi:hypothetical protein
MQWTRVPPDHLQLVLVAQSRAQSRCLERVSPDGMRDGVATAVVFGTSYPQQPALWSAMAMLLSWRSVAEHVFMRDTARDDSVCTTEGTQLVADV